MYQLFETDAMRLQKIKDEIDAWLSVHSELSVIDIMPDLIYLVERLEKAEKVINYFQSKL